MEPNATTNVQTHICLDTPEQIMGYREILIYNGLKFEVNTARNGRAMKVSRGISCFAIAKRVYALKGNREKVLAALKEILDAKYPGVLDAAK
ncbi:MAG: hypothetical protein JW384_01146 [Nitrosomonadaceae bacterium]|nr:hypothetical protein [Nitrosomonadaceae bacterium]